MLIRTRRATCKEWFPGWILTQHGSAQDVSAAMPSPRAHQQLLLVLARARLSDNEGGGVPESEAGWVHADDLEREVDVDRSRIDVELCRARRNLRGPRAEHRGFQAYASQLGAPCASVLTAA